MKWTSEEISFLQENYPNYGYDYCMVKLNKTKNQIIQKAHKLQIKLNKDIRSKKCSRIVESKNKVPYEKFLNIKNKEIAYILGFIWADGHIRKPYGISISINSKDSIDIKNVFEKTGDWNYYDYKKYDKRTKKSYNSFQIQTSNKYIVKFLIENNYDKKSFVSPFKILSKIPENLHTHFYRGYSDGDGCFYINPANHTYQYIISGDYKQDWTFMEQLYKNLNIKYSIKHIINKKGNSSLIRITNKNDVDVFGKYIYSKDNIGLKRKFNKFKEIENIKVTRVIRWSEEDVKFLKENYLPQGCDYCSKKLNRSKKSTVYKYFTLKRKNLI